ncbi:MAG: ABC transporter permease [Acidocella sp. 20-57-95]|nr:MAG: ABC transporter permease [Acidocella sp. 20-57-95]OYV59103.1 MAG: ABC transporter permease [Acidocella sp. 21-58-7]HQT64145.1 ABC transporter permease [Acidocella sp.]HQU03597.1 ABC transporter permease [Acidocella sp.]
MRLSPLWQRRLAVFRAHRRGRLSLSIFACVFVVSMAANFIANDKPLLMAYRGQLYIPAVQFIPETTFGDYLPTEADFTNPTIKAAINAHGWMLWPPIPYSYDTIVWNAGPMAPAPPSARNWLGTDEVSRDVLARVIYGLRISILFGFGLTIAASLIGIIAGAVQGFYGGLTDLLFQRFIEIWSGMPQLFLLIILASIIAPSFWVLLLFLLLFSWMTLTGVVRAEFLRARNLDYVRAAKALGVPDWRIMARHMLPNAMIATLTFLPFILSDSVTVLASLDFLGFGMPPGAPSLGELVSEAKNNLQAPWLACTAFATLGGILILLIFIGEAVRDAFDPRKTQ